MEAADKPKKRQRMSVVCLNCKTRKIKCDKKRPACSNCVKCNVGHLCEYEPPHWVTRASMSSASNAIQAIAQQIEPNGTPLPALMPPISAPLAPFPETVNSPPRTASSDNAADAQMEVKEELMRLRAQIQSLQSSVVGSHELDTDTVDFYELYNALHTKRSSMEEHKPLCSVTHYKKDQFSAVLSGYFNLCCALFKAKYGDLKKKQESQKTRLDASLTEFLYLLGERESPEVVEVVSKFIQERMPKNDQNNNISFLLPNKHTKGTDTILSHVQSLLPTLGVIKLYLNRFYQFIYPYFPFVDKKVLNERIFTILRAQDDESAVSIVIDDKFDMLSLAQLLIILRMVHIAQPSCTKDVVLKQNPISAELIGSAVTIISLFKITRKTKLSVIQTLILLRLYLLYAPEDGDGSELTQSQTLFAMIVQSAYAIGLNRDASNHPQMDFDKDLSNLWRRVWYGILDIDRVISTLAGHICCIQNLHSYNVEFPIVDETDSLIDREVTEEYRRSEPLLKMYYDLSNMVNNLANSPRVCDLLDLLNRMEVYVNINYSLETMQPLVESTSDAADVTNFINSKRFLHQFQVYSFKLAVYQSLTLHYESLEYQDPKKSREFLVKNLEAAQNVTNIACKFLMNQYNNYVDSDHKFYLNRFIENVFQRAMNTLISLLIRLYHASDLMSRSIGNNSEALVGEITELTFRIASGVNVLVQNTLGTKYYQAFKTSLKYKFYIRSLRSEGYKCIRDTIEFIDDKFLDDPAARLTMLLRIDLTLGTSTALKQLDSMNYLITSSREFLLQVKNIVSGFDILEDKSLSNEQVIWEPSFKQLSLNEIRGVQTVDDATLLRGLGVGEFLPREVEQTSNSLNLGQLLTVNGPVRFDDLFKTNEEYDDWLSRL